MINNAKYSPSRFYISIMFFNVVVYVGKTSSTHVMVTGPRRDRANRQSRYQSSECRHRGFNLT
jgi:hypothetical protein